MIELRKALHKHLKTIHPRVYFQRAPDTAQFPYLTYSSETVPDGEGFELIVLDIDGWDMPASGDTTQLENLMTDVDRAMNKTTLTTDDLVVSFYLDRKLALEDDNPKIIRRKYVYQGRLFERGDNWWL
jgi:hypothetical protein